MAREKFYQHLIGQETYMAYNAYVNGGHALWTCGSCDAVNNTKWSSQEGAFKKCHSCNELNKISW